MPALTTSGSRALQLCVRHQLPAARLAPSLAMQKRNVSEAHTTSSFDSPFRGLGSNERTTKIPSFAKYKSKTGEQGMKTYQYFMVGTLGALSALGAKATVQGGYMIFLALRQNQVRPYRG